MIDLARSIMDGKVKRWESYGSSCGLPVYNHPTYIFVKLGSVHEREV
jgi:hypothetical protein